VSHRLPTRTRAHEVVQATFFDPVDVDDPGMQKAIARVRRAREDRGGAARWRAHVQKVGPEIFVRWPGAQPTSRENCALHLTQLGPVSHMCIECHCAAWDEIAARFQGTSKADQVDVDALAVLLHKHVDELVALAYVGKQAQAAERFLQVVEDECGMCENMLLDLRDVALTRHEAASTEVA
jgi:hypothetical protein